LKKRCFFSLKYIFCRLLLCYAYYVYWLRVYCKDERLFRLLVNHLLFRA
jgi:hypothetical protein